MQEKVCVILVNYNGKKYNDKCIESLFKSVQCNTPQVLIVDNASTDGSLESLYNRWGDQGQVEIIPLGKNYGFSKGNNVGIRWALEHGFHYIMLLNNDTEIRESTIAAMLKCQANTGGIVVPKILYADNPDTVWCAGGEFSAVIKKPRHIGAGVRDQGQFEKSRRCTFANGCCLLLTDEIIDKAGLLDEDFFLYYEDTEYSLRAGEKGVEIWYCGEAVVYHKVNGATKGNERPENAYYITRNWLMCHKKHLKAGRFMLFIFYFLLNRLAWAFIWTCQGKRDMVKGIAAGITDFMKGRTGKVRWT